VKIAVLSDVHANAIALEAVLADAEKQKCDHTLVLGDLIGYYYWPAEVVRRLRSLQACTLIQGNHERMLAASLESEESAREVRERYGSGVRVACEELCQVELDWLVSLPESARITLDGASFSLFHGSDRDPDEYLYPDCSAERLSQIATESDYVLVGHTHYPALFRRGNTLILNPGSVGQPRDVGALASYAIVDTANAGVVYRRIAFCSEEIEEEAKRRDPHLPYLHTIMNRNRSDV